MALVIFSLTYLVLAGVRVPFVTLDRPGAALIGAAAMVAFGALSGPQAVAAVDADTIVLLLGMMVLSAALTQAGFFGWAAFWVLHLAKSPRALLLGLTAVAGVLSAVLVNDTVCLMLTPLVLDLVRRAGLAPKPYLFALAMAANAGSAATFTGNPQNMIIAVASHQAYGRFAAFMLLPAVLSLAVVYGLVATAFAAELRPRPLSPLGEAPAVDRALLAKSLAALVAVLLGFFAGLPMAWTALAGAAGVVLLARVEPRALFEKVDFVLLVFFCCLFVVVAGLNAEGWAERLHALFAPVLAGSGGPGQTLGFAALTLAGSNLFSNVPFVVLARAWVPAMPDAGLAWQVLALASTLAGNLTLIGSVANLIVFESARKAVPVTFVEYARLGVPVTLASLALGLGALGLEHWLLGG